MTKKSFLTLVSAVFLVFMLAACGNNEKKEESENNDTGDTDTDTETPSGGDDLPANDPGPSDGGCEAVTGSLSILVLAGLALVSKKKRQ